MTDQNRANFPDFVSFEDQGGCFSSMGRQGGKQIVSLGAGCTAGNAIHEIGHTVGLWHEQSRKDRDQFITVKFENIIPSAAHNFNQQITDGQDQGAYDYGSIMHYPKDAFSKNGQDTIIPTGGQPIGQRDGLSGGDIAGVKAIYPD